MASVRRQEAGEDKGFSRVCITQKMLMGAWRDIVSSDEQMRLMTIFASGGCNDAYFYIDACRVNGVCAKHCTEAVTRRRYRRTGLGLAQIYRGTMRASLRSVVPIKWQLCA